MVVWWNGRHSVLKIRRAQAHGGSSPSTTTNENQENICPQSNRGRYGKAMQGWIDAFQEK
jgi:hypothetical protein